MAAPASLWMVGCGNMAGAMLRRWIDAETLDPRSVFVVNRHDRELPEGVRQGRAFPDEPLPDAVMLGTKPQQLAEVVAAHGARIAGVPLLISILAGVEETTLRDRLHPVGAVVRAMPNLPVAIGKGVVALYSASADPEARARTDALMAPLGLAEWVEDETQFGAVGVLAGCGPAFVYRFIDAMGAAGAALGIPAEQAQRLALATVEGAGLLAAQAEASPAALADQVASPGGTTRKGLDVLDAGDALRRLLSETLAASERRGAEMAREARNA